MHWQLLTVVLVVAAPAPPEKEKKDEEKIQGTWVVTSVEDGGRAEADKVGVKFVFEGDAVTIKDPRRDEKAKIKLDPAKKPKAIDITAAEGGGPAKMVQGIYEFNGDELKICFTKGAGGRPTEFVSKPDSNVTLIVLKREKKEK
jgi:uncharacterized protein (TIGR03067 family)